MTRYWWFEKITPHYSHGYNVIPIYEKRTPYQHLLIYKNELWGRFLVLDGITQFTEKDEFIYHETIVFCPAASLETPPEKVLVIGGGDGGVIRELQKISEIKSILQLEIDQEVFKACQKYLREIAGDYSDPRVEFRIADGAKFVAEAPAETYDLVIVDCTDPIGPAVVLYTEEFYKNIARVLKPKGCFIQQASIPRFFPETLPMAYHRAQKAFPVVEILRAPVPCYGDEIAFILGSKTDSACKPRRSYHGKFYNPAVHQASFAIPSWWQDLLKQ
ncbi:Spermine synthase [Thermodesulfatator indicus DSM 15286]|uniref:Polyamine aminopropyltransferase n=1 Tax=Thermodesulfatator indicus (strain DSM 15286 / JCM 11887 / CIR29812) TaxID=667014 RepID=F8ABT5_THEID|nr:polyamine aminopropyltransferase [Thermodesulfatator indicus]AEH44539.1 Spermine synthase [Thermodesulfatator indicus DSM 15286]